MTILFYMLNVILWTHILHMKHLVILLFLLSFSSSALTLFLLILLYLRDRSPVTKYFFLFWLSFFGVLIIVFINTYGKINISGFSNTSILYLFSIGNGFTILIFYFMLKFFTVLKGTSFSVLEKTFILSFLSFYVIQILVILLIRRDIQWKMDMIQLSSVPYNLILLLFLATNIFYFIRQSQPLSNFLTVKQTKLLFSLCCVTVLFSAIDMSTGFFPSKGQLYSFPISYTVWSIVIAIYGAVHYSKEPRYKFNYSLSDGFVGEYRITQRELEIIQLLFKGLSCPEISSELFISYKTVDKHISNIYKKTGAHNRLQLMAKAGGKHPW